MRFILLAVYSALLVVTASAIALTLHRYPLFPLDTASLEWSNAWLAATVIDYYGAALCFCGVIISTEETWTAAVAWTAACCLLGSPFCCLYVLSKVARGKSLRLEPKSGPETYDRLSH